MSSSMTANTKPSGGRRHSGDSRVSQFIPLPPDGGYGWIIVMASFANHVIVDGITFTFGIFYGEFLEHFGASKGQTSLVGALLAGCYLLSAPFAGSMVNRFGCRAVSITGSVIATIAFVSSTAVSSINLLAVTYGLLGGLGLGLLYLPNIVAVSYYFERRRAMATGIAVCGAGVGTFVMAPVGRWLLDVYDWKNAMLIVAAISLNGCVFGALLRPIASPRFESEHTPSSDDVTTDFDIPTDVDKKRPDSAIVLLEGANSGLVKADSLDHVTDESAKEAPGASSQQSPPSQPKFQSLFARRRSHSDAHLLHLSRGRNRNVQIAFDSEQKFDHGSKQGSKTPTGTGNGIMFGRTDSRRYRSESCMNAVGGVSGHVTQRQSSVEHENYARPMYRRDIFYSGSTLRLPEFQQQQQDVSKYVRQITVIPNELDTNDGNEQSNSSNHCLVPVSKAVQDAWKQMTGLSLLKDPAFLVPCIGNFFGTVGLFVPFVYCAERAVSLGVEAHHAAFLLSVIGITNTVGRIGAGCLASLPQVNSLLLHNVALVIAGLACICQAMFGINFSSMATWAALFGLCIATWISLTSVVLCDILGLERLTNAFGLLTMTRGFAAMVGSPAAGFVYDLTGNYDTSFYVGGAIMTVGGLLCCLLHMPMCSSHIKKHTEAGGAGQQGLRTPESGFEDLESDLVMEITETAINSRSCKQTPTQQ